MAERKISLQGLKDMAAKSVSSIDMEAARERVQKTGEFFSDKAQEIKDSASELKDDLSEKRAELDRMLEAAIRDYNEAYTLMSDKGIQLFLERSRAVDTIAFIENLVNSISNRPKSFDAEFEEIDVCRDSFLNASSFGEKELQAAREAAGGAGAGLAAGASVAFMGPSAAMWVATTFGTASTGTAISTLSGAAAKNAALAWLGGGALSAHGGGMAAGNALLAMAGPIGVSIAGASLLASILLFTSKRAKINKKKNEEIEYVKRNTERILEADAQISEILTETIMIREGLNRDYAQRLDMFGKDYNSFSEEQKRSLGALVNQTKTLSSLLKKTIS